VSAADTAPVRRLRTALREIAAVQRLALAAVETELQTGRDRRRAWRRDLRAKRAELALLAAVDRLLLATVNGRH